MPVLVVFGDSDMLLDAEKSIDRIRRLAPKVTSVVLPGVGHAVINQAPLSNPMHMLAKCCERTDQSFLQCGKFLRFSVRLGS